MENKLFKVGSLSSYRLFFSFFILVFMPHFIFVSLVGESLALGLMVSALIVFFLNVDGFLSIKFPLWFVFLFSVFFIFLLVCVASSILLYEAIKPVLSFAMLMFLFLAIVSLGENISMVSFDVFLKALRVMIVVLFVVGWLGVFFPVDGFNYALRIKPVFPFSEPSHFSLTFGLFLVLYSSVGSFKFILFAFLNSVAIGLLYPNMTVLVFSLLIIFIATLRLQRKKSYIIIMFLPLFLIFFVWSLFHISPYFSDRLDIRTTDNLTALVYMQGWQLAYLNFTKTIGMGLGFQMLGEAPTQTGSISQKISVLSDDGSIANLADGGFLASKVIAEFGIIGLLLTLVYLVLIIKAIFLLIKKANYKPVYHARRDVDLFLILVCSACLGYSVEYFLRGIGYFSPNLVVVLSVIYSLIRLRVRINDR